MLSTSAQLSGRELGRIKTLASRIVFLQSFGFRSDNFGGNNRSSSRGGFSSRVRDDDSRGSIYNRNRDKDSRSSGGYNGDSRGSNGYNGSENPNRGGFRDKDTNRTNNFRDGGSSRGGFASRSGSSGSSRSDFSQRKSSQTPGRFSRDVEEDSKEFPVIAPRSRREVKEQNVEAYEERRKQMEPRPKKDPSTITNSNHLKRIEERKKSKVNPVYRTILDADPEDADVSPIVSPENPNLPSHIKKNWESIPDHLRVCRGCGAGFQCDDQSSSGFVPSHHFAAFVERTTLQLQAARHDLRVRSGGGKGKGTAVAALHASMQAALIQEESAMEEKVLMGAYSLNKLAEMGLDADMKPLPSSPDYDENGNIVTYNENALVRAYDPEGARRAKLEHEKAKKAGFEEISPDAELAEDGKIVPDKKFSPEVTKPIRKDEIIEYRDLKTIENAAKKAAKPLRCMRCHQLATSAVPRGAVAAVRSEDFVALLKNEFLLSGGQSCVIIKMVDLFDFHGSFIRDFKSMAGGRNPIILCVNKIDLLPAAVGRNRVAAWIKREAAKYNIHYHSLALISASTGEGIEELTKKAYSLARGANSPTAPGNRNIYVVGTTNVGKSTLVNALMKKNFIGTGLPTDIAGMSYRKAVKSGFTDGVVDAPDVDHSEAATEKAAQKGENIDEPKDVSLRLQVTKIPASTLEKVIPSEYLVDYHQELLRNSSYTTTSPIPGTTLGIVSFPILETKRGGRNLQLRDTPGVLNAHQLSSYLHYDELKAVLPTSQMKPLTYRVKPGQSILIGAFARIDVLAGRPFFLSTFVSRRVTVHITATKNITREYLKQNLGTTIFPPYDYLDRAETLHVYDALALEPHEIEQMEELQETSKEEFKSSMARVSQISGRRAGDRFGKDDYNDAMTLSLEAPKSAKDRTATLRLEGKKTVNTTLESDKLVPVETSIDTDSPARSFIDSKGRVVYQLQGNGWEEASHDVVLAGLGWVSTTGVGPLTLRVALAGEKLDVPADELQALAEQVTFSKREQDNRNNRVEQAMHRAGVTEYDPRDMDAGLSAEEEGAAGLHPQLQKIYARTQLRNPLLPYDNRQILKFTGASEAVKLYGAGAEREQMSREEAESVRTKGYQARAERQNLREVVPSPAPFFEEGDEAFFDPREKARLATLDEIEYKKMEPSATPVFVDKNEAKEVSKKKSRAVDSHEEEDGVFDLKALGLDHDLLSDIDVSDFSGSDFDVEKELGEMSSDVDFSASDFSDLPDNSDYDFSGEGEGESEVRNAPMESEAETETDVLASYRAMKEAHQARALEASFSKSVVSKVSTKMSMASVFNDATFDSLATPEPPVMPTRERRRVGEDDAQRLKMETESAWKDVLRIREARKMTPEEEEEAKQRTLATIRAEKRLAKDENDIDLPSDVEAFEDPFSEDEFDSEFDSDLDASSNGEGFDSQFEDVTIGGYSGSDMDVEFGSDSEFSQFEESEIQTSDPGVAKLYELARLAKDDGVSDFEGEDESDIEHFTRMGFTGPDGTPVNRQQFSKLMHAEKAKIAVKTGRGGNKISSEDSNRPRGDFRAAGSLFTPGKVPEFARREASYDPAFEAEVKREKDQSRFSDRKSGYGNNNYGDKRQGGFQDRSRQGDFDGKRQGGFQDRSRQGDFGEKRQGSFQDRSRQNDFDGKRQGGFQDRSRQNDFSEKRQDGFQDRSRQGGFQDRGYGEKSFDRTNDKRNDSFNDRRPSHDRSNSSFNDRRSDNNSSFGNRSSGSGFAQQRDSQSNTYSPPKSKPFTPAQSPSQSSGRKSFLDDDDGDMIISTKGKGRR